MEKRDIRKYFFLNCLTMGIYGFITAKKMGEEINELCKGDNEEPKFGYVAAFFIRFIPVAGMVYFNYWWYHQINRVKLNAHRYGIDVKESGTDAFLMRTVLEAPLSIITVLELAASLIVPALVTLLFGLISPIAAIVVGSIFACIVLVFSAELTAGANFSNYYLMKNLNRFVDVYRNGAAPFDPMAYEYYPNAGLRYPEFVPGVINGGYVGRASAEETVPAPAPDTDYLPDLGKIIGEKGSCAGYAFDLNGGEEIIIGKDAKVSMVVIDPAYKEISRKHVGVCYEAYRDQYRVVDYSSNGTWANGSKLTPGKEYYLPHGTELKLANDKNIFRLG